MNLSRRQFVVQSAAIGAATVVSAASSPSSPSVAVAETSPLPTYKTQLFRAMITKTPDEAFCEKLVANGFGGMEVTAWDVTPQEAAKSRQMAEKFGLRCHSVMRGWAEFNNDDAEKAKKSLEDTKTAIRAAAGYGADTILLVPCRTGGTVPQPWDFRIDFDPKTLHVKTVVEGDNSPFAEYIAVQNRSTDMSIRAIEELIPLAAREGVVIALENVWCNLWVMPDFFAAFVRYFDNVWVKTYLDLGNHTRYARPELWVAALSDTLVKLHIKGYKIEEVLNPFGGGKGTWCKVDEANIDWIAVRNVLDKVNYNGWLTLEEGGYPMEKYAAIMDDFIAGKPMR